MAIPAFDRIRLSLEAKRDSVLGWLDGFPDERKAAALGPTGEGDVRAHLEVIDQSLQQVEAGTLGMCVVCHEPVEQDLLELNYTSTVCITHFSQDEIRTLERELELAQRVQRSLLPAHDPHIPGLDVAAFRQPAQIVGGDYFDFIRFLNGDQGLIIADVAGHGISAGLQMASLQAMLRSVIPGSTSPAEVVRQLHNLFIHNIRFTTFVTLFVGAFDPDSGVLLYSNAGHNPPLLLRDSQTPGDRTVWLVPTGPAIGLVEGADFKEASIELSAGDLMILYTDGVIETVDGRKNPYGVDRLRTRANRARARSPREVLRDIRDELQDFAAGESLDDDSTLVVARVV